MPLVFTLFRFRFYSAWLLAEIMCMSAGFGAYPLASKPKPGLSLKFESVERLI